MTESVPPSAICFLLMSSVPCPFVPFFPFTDFFWINQRNVLFCYISSVIFSMSSFHDFKSLSGHRIFITRNMVLNKESHAKILFVGGILLVMMWCKEPRCGEQQCRADLWCSGEDWKSALRHTSSNIQEQNSGPSSIWAYWNLPVIKTLCLFT